MAETWTGTAWFIESDISDCFGSFDHKVMLSILAEKIHDNRFLRLIKQMLQAGYLEDWEYHDTLSGVPQGGVVSPVLSNIYLHRMDEFVETVLMPEYTRGERRASNPAYFRIRWQPGAHAHAATTPRRGNCERSNAACPARTPMIRATGGCGMSGMPTMVRHERDWRLRCRRSR